MATFKPVVSYKRADGTYRVQIRIIHNRQKKIIGTQIYITDNDLTRSKKIKNRAILDQLDEIVKDMRNKCNRYGLALDCKTIDEVAEIATSENLEDWHLDFVQYCQDRIDSILKEKRNGTAKTYQTALNSFVKHINRSIIDVNSITRDILVGWLKNIQSSMVSAHIYFGKIKTCYADARKEFNDEDAGIIRIPRNPFNNISVEYNQPTKKKAVTAETIRQIQSIEKDIKRGQINNDTALARDMFLLSFYLCGCNLVDLFNASPSIDGYLIYNRQKTKDRRKDNAEIKLLIQPEAQAIIDRYADTDGKRLLNLYHHYNSYNSFQVCISIGMKNISTILGQKVIFYSARHSWATLAVNKVGINKYVVHQALNHVDGKTAITDVYIEKDWAIVDNANRMVIDYINKVTE